MTWPPLIISTSQALLTFINGDWKIAHRGNGVYYGITWDDSHVYVLCRNGEVREGDAESILDLKSGEHFLTGEFSGGHQIHWSDGLYICDTGHDRILRWSGALSPVFETGAGHDSRHINSVWGSGDEFWTGECNHRYKALKINRIRKFWNHWREQEAIPVPNGIHNVYREGDLLYVCDSVRGQLVSFTLQREVVKTTPIGGWTRGLARLQDGWVVGTSQFMAHAKDRYRGDCALYLLNENFRAIDMVVLRGFGQVYDIRAMEGDPAHNNLPMPEIAV